MRRWLTRNLVILTLVSLTQDAASELIYPLLPLFVTGVLVAPPIVLGLVEGVAEATAGVTRYVSGRWSDTAGRKPFVAWGYGFAAGGKVLVAAAEAWPVLLAGRVVDRFGKGMRSSPRDALIAQSTPPADFGKAFGFHRAGDTLGAVIGPLLGLVALTALHGDVRAAMWWAVVPATMSVLLVLLVREPRDAGSRLTRTERRRARRAEVREPALRSPLPPSFWRVAAVLVTITLVNFPDALLLLRLLDLGFSTTAMVLAYVGFNLVYTLGAYPAGALADRWPRPIVYAVGLGAFVVGYLGLGLSHGGPWAIVFIGIYGLFPAFTDGVGKAWISSLVPDRHRGRAQGVFQMLTSGSLLLAGVWAGALWGAGPGHGIVPLAISGAAAAVAALALLAFRRHLPSGTAPALPPDDVPRA